MDVQISKRIEMVRAIAIFSVICAHCAAIESGTNQFNIFFSNLLEIIGTAGIGAFFAISGFLSVYSKSTYKDYIINRLRMLIPPWVVTGALVYLYIAIRKGNLSVSGILAWLVGIDTYLWYMPVLLFLLVAIFPIRSRKSLIITCCVLSIVSIVMTSTGLLSIRYNYLNPFNFMREFPANR